MPRSRLIDCAVLLYGQQESWLSAWLDRDFSTLPRVHLHAYPLMQNSQGYTRVDALRHAALLLRRYDVALLPVDGANLSWVRTMLANMPERDLPIPLLALVSGLQAPGIQDLLDLGVADFLRVDACLDDLRVRLDQLQAQAASRNWVWQNIQDDTGGYRIAIPAPHVLADSLDAPAATSLQESASCARTDLLEPFQVAKSRVIASFERDYIIRMLMHHAGNISMAARAAQKHRRAFWALMRKHQIDAVPYRDATFTGFGNVASR